MSVVSAQVQASLLDTINTRIDILSKSERVTRTELAFISRELIEYIVLNGSPDVGAVNRLLDVLTPMNKKTAILFFTAFIPHKMDNGVFGKKDASEKKMIKLFDQAKEFLSNEDNNIWTWAEANVVVDKVPQPFHERITHIVKQSLEGTKKQEAIQVHEVLAAVLAAGVTIEDMFAMVNGMTMKEAAE